MKIEVAARAAPGGWRVEVARGAEVLAAFDVAAADARTPAGALTPKAVKAAVDGLAANGATIPQIHALGDYLFAALVAPAWPAVVAAIAGVPLVELALVLDAALAHLPWELMRANGAFLAAGVTANDAVVDVAITRRVPRAPAAHPALAQPLRYLFALGTALDDRVRAGAESLGLLRQIAPAVRERIVQRQSLARLATEVREFDPHVVHAICHGSTDGRGGARLEMWNDDTGAAQQVSPAELAEALVRTTGDAKRAPTIAILSACSSGQPLDASVSAGIAGALVAGGVPLVVAMSAEISDLACRLFTRCFGAAIEARTSLLAAAVAGRRAALRSPKLPADAFDWGLIQIVLGHDVDTGLAVAARTPSSDEDFVMARLGKASLPIDLHPTIRKHPPLCGAPDALDGFAQLMASDSLAALVLHARPPRPGVKLGKRRAFAEVAACAIRAGHLPVIAMPSRASGYPVEPPALVVAIREAFKKARLHLGLEVPVAEPPWPETDLDLRIAIEAAARALETEARAKYDFVRRANGEAILMLHDVHLYSNAVPLALGLLAESTGAGAGSLVRVVLSWAKVAATTTAPFEDDAPDEPPWRRGQDHQLDLALGNGSTWIRSVELVPFAGLHAKLAYQRVLLHPLGDAASHPVRWFLDLRRDDDALQEALTFLANATENACAGQMRGREFSKWLAAVVAPTSKMREKRAVREAEDDDVLSGLVP